MKATASITLFAAFAAVAMALPQANFQPRIPATNSLAGGGGGSISDDFNRSDSDSLGANWTEIAGDVDISGNELSAPTTFDFSHRAAAYTGSSCGSVEQWVKVSFTGDANQRPGVVFRYADASSAHYEIQFDDNNDVVRWKHWTTPAGTSSEVALAALTMSWPLTVGVVCTGTGNSTEIRVWTSPSGAAPDSGGGTWGGAAPTLTLTDNPTSPVDTGNYVGLGGADSSGGELTWDNFSGGAIP